MDKEFWKAGLKFSCMQCSACCRFDPGFVFLSENDLSRLLKWSQMPKEAFLHVYCRWVKNGAFEYLCLKEKSNYDCILWKDGCTAYEARPIQCSTFPFWDYLIANVNNWNNAARSCPGIGKLKMHSADEILKLLECQKDNPCIKR